VIIHQPGSPAYRAATSLWNGAVEHRPAGVATPNTTTEISAAVRRARREGKRPTVRGGGHDWAGRALADDALVIDMSGMRNVEVDVTGRTAVIAGGATAADVVAVTEPHGLLPATGTVDSVGMVGLTLAGGYGPLCGVAGLALDTVEAFTVVLADGRVVTADSTSHADLFWALRGGGGNFGVVADMRIALHEIDQLTTGLVTFPWNQAADVLSGFSDMAPSMPDALTVQSGLIPGPDGDPVPYLAPTWAGHHGDAMTHIERLTTLGTPTSVDVAPMAHADMLAMFGRHAPAGLGRAMRTRNVATLDEHVVGAILAACGRSSSPLNSVAIHHFHGAATRIPLGDTAFGIRTEHFMVEILATWPSQSDASDHDRWADALYTDLADLSLRGGYPNLIGPGQRAQAEKSYGADAARLLAAKRTYDPEYVFAATALPADETSADFGGQLRDDIGQL
jgi:FAD/FMN-containing dehydrogenase